MTQSEKLCKLVGIKPRWTHIPVRSNVTGEYIKYTTVISKEEAFSQFGYEHSYQVYPCFETNSNNFVGLLEINDKTIKIYPPFLFKKENDNGFVGNFVQAIISSLIYWQGRNSLEIIKQIKQFKKALQQAEWEY